MDAMLVLTRKPGEKIHIGSGISITVVGVQGNKIRLGIDAPEDVPIFRAELNDFFLASIGAEPASAGRKRERETPTLALVD
jgi:carbon storage regulator